MVRTDNPDMIYRNDGLRSGGAVAEEIKALREKGSASVTGGSRFSVENSVLIAHERVEAHGQSDTTCLHYAKPENAGREGGELSLRPVGRGRRHRSPRKHGRPRERTSLLGWIILSSLAREQLKSKKNRQADRFLERGDAGNTIEESVRVHHAFDAGLNTR
jgi:hypothetical protein